MALRWFRFAKKQEEQEALEAATPEVAAPSEALRSLRPQSRRRRSPGGRDAGRPEEEAPPRKSRGARKEEAVDGGVGAPTTGGASRLRLRPSPARRSSRQGAERQADAKPDRRQPRGGGRRRTPTKRAPLPAAKRELMISVDVGEQRVAILEDDRVAEVYLERPERRSIAGNIYLGVVDNVLPGMEAAFVEIGLEKNGFLYVDEIVGPELEGRKGAREDPGPDQARPDDHGSGGQGPDEVEGRAPHDRDLAPRTVPRLRAERRRARRLAPPRGRRADAAQGDRQEPRSQGRRDHRPHRGRGRVGRGHRARPRLSPAALEDDPDEGEGRDRAGARLRGGRASAAHRARPLRRRLRRRADRRRSDASADRELPQEDLAAHGRARPPLPREGAALRGIRRRRRDPLDTRPPGRPPVRRLPRLRLRGGVHRHRREHGPVRRLPRQERAGPARGHDRRRTTSRP